MEFRSKKFQSAINQIPQCDWIERAHEMEKRLGRDCAFGMAKQVQNYLSKNSNSTFSQNDFDNALILLCILSKNYMSRECNN